MASVSETKYLQHPQDSLTLSRLEPLKDFVDITLRNGATQNLLVEFGRLNNFCQGYRMALGQSRQQQQQRQQPPPKRFTPSSELESRNPILTVLVSSSGITTAPGRARPGGAAATTGWNDMGQDKAGTKRTRTTITVHQSQSPVILTLISTSAADTMTALFVPLSTALPSSSPSSSSSSAGAGHDSHRLTVSVKKAQVTSCLKQNHDHDQTR